MRLGCIIQELEFKVIFCYYKNMKIKINFSKFKGKEVAIIKGKVVACGNSSKEVFSIAQKKNPLLDSKEIILLSVPNEKAFVYLTNN